MTRLVNIAHHWIWQHRCCGRIKQFYQIQMQHFCFLRKYPFSTDKCIVVLLTLSLLMRSNYEMFSNWVPGVGDLPTHVANQIAVMPAWDSARLQLYNKYKYRWKALREDFIQLSFSTLLISLSLSFFISLSPSRQARNGSLLTLSKLHLLSLYLNFYNACEKSILYV